MNIFELVSMHMKAMRLPLCAVTVSVADQVNTPALLIMHWHGFRRVTPLTLPDVNLSARPVPDSVLQLDATWGRLEALDQPLLNAAWQFGAWGLERVEHKAWWRPGAPANEALACQRAFGCYAGAVDAACPVVTSAQTANDREVLLELAARVCALVVSAPTGRNLGDIS